MSNTLDDLANKIALLVKIASIETPEAQLFNILNSREDILDYKEYYKPQMETAALEVTFKNQQTLKFQYSIEDAKREDNYNTSKHWKLYPQRMLRLRARREALHYFIKEMSGLI